MVGVRRDPAVSVGGDTAPVEGDEERSPRRARWRRTVFGAGLVTLLGAVALATSSVVVGHETPGALTVDVSDAGSPSTESCSAEDYTDTFFDGAEVALLDEAGAVVGSHVLEGAGQPSRDGCVWTVEFTDVPESDAYTIRLRSTGAPAREHAFGYTPEALAERGWHLWVSVFA